MPLSIEIKSGDKIIVNGAVIENAGPNTKLVVHNQAAVLRGKEVMTEEDSQTPASRTYFALQNAYIFPVHEEHYLNQFNELLDDYVKAAPSARPIADEVREIIAEGGLYKALKAAQKLVRHENEVLGNMVRQLRSTLAELEASEQGSDGQPALAGPDDRPPEADDDPGT